MQKKQKRTYLLLIIILLAIIIVLSAFLANRKMQSLRNQLGSEVISLEAEIINEEPVPMAAPQTAIKEETEIPATSEPLDQNTTETVHMNAQPSTASIAQPSAPAPEPLAPSGVSAAMPAEPENTAPEENSPIMAEETATPTPSPTPTPTPTTTPAKAQKPDDITNVTSMAKYLFDAATEFWAVEKDFSGTTTRPVSTRVAASIGAGTAVDCPGGDTVRIDKDGNPHDSYAIGDHFRDYVEMPDLQYFKIYLSEKDYTENSYGAREDVIGSYYQYGSERSTYMAEDDKEEE